MQSYLNAVQRDLAETKFIKRQEMQVFAFKSDEIRSEERR